MIRFQISGAKVSVSIWFTALVFFLLMLGNRYTALCILFASAHEAGHILPLILSGGRIKEFKLLFFCLELRSENERMSKASEYMSILGGSGINIVIAVVLFFFGMRKEAVLSAAFAALNLLPAKGLDGGELIMRIAEGVRGEAAAKPLIKSISVICGVLVLLLGILTFVYNRNPIGIAIGAILIFNSFANI